MNNYTMQLFIQDNDESGYFYIDLNVFFTNVKFF